MKLAIGTPTLFPTIKDNIVYAGDWSLIPLNIHEVLHGNFHREIDEFGFYRLSDGSQTGIVGIDTFAEQAIFIALSDILATHLQVWVEDSEKNTTIRSMLARVYSKGEYAVARIHPKQFHHLLDLKKMPKDSVMVGVSCLASDNHYNFQWQGELKLPPLAQFHPESPKVYTM